MQNKPWEIGDCGTKPCVYDLGIITDVNTAFRRTLWTGTHLQLTVMCIPIGGEIGAEQHDDVDQFLRIESGCAKVMFGTCRNAERFAKAGDAILIPAGTRHNVINTGDCPLKAFSLYAPPNHPKGTVHHTKAEADREEY